MPSGRIHLQSSLILAASFSGAALILNDIRLLECAGGAMLGVILSPDLDVDKGNVSNFIIRKQLGNFAERSWRWFWKGYSESFKHRGFASHFPVFSTFVRLFYIYYLLVFIPHALFYIAFSPSWDFGYVLRWYAMYIFNPVVLYGLCSSDFIHWFLDFAITEIDKWRLKKDARPVKNGRTKKILTNLNSLKTDFTTLVNNAHQKPREKRLPLSINTELKTNCASLAENYWTTTSRDVKNA